MNFKIFYNALIQWLEKFENGLASRNTTFMFFNLHFEAQSGECAGQLSISNTCKYDRPSFKDKGKKPLSLLWERLVTE